MYCFTSAFNPSTSPYHSKKLIAHYNNREVRFRKYQSANRLLRLVLQEIV